MQQPDAARSQVQQPAAPLPEVLALFSAFVSTFGPKVRLWGNSALYDLGILSTAYHTTGIPIPWKPGNERDFRTLKKLFPVHIERQGTHHHPVDDCRHQIRQLHAIARQLPTAVF